MYRFRLVILSSSILLVTRLLSIVDLPMDVVTDLREKSRPLFHQIDLLCDSFSFLVLHSQFIEQSLKLIDVVLEILIFLSKSVKSSPSIVHDISIVVACLTKISNFLAILGQIRLELDLLLLELSELCLQDFI